MNICFRPVKGDNRALFQVEVHAPKETPSIYLILFRLQRQAVIAGNYLFIYFSVDSFLNTKPLITLRMDKLPYSLSLERM